MADVSFFPEIILVLAAFATAIVSATVGIFGGLLLISVMTFFFPPAALIPLHGVVQLGSNGSRAFFLRKNIHWHIAVTFALGAVGGALLGSQIVLRIPEDIYRLSLGSFILLVTWLPKIGFKPKRRVKFFVLGLIATFLSLFFGAIGPIIGPFFMHEPISKEEIVATIASAQVWVHTLKIFTFGLLGFSFFPYWKLLVGMVVAVVFGSYVGKKLLGRINERLFRILLKTVITLIAARMIFQGLYSVVAS